MSTNSVDKRNCEFESSYSGGLFCQLCTWRDQHSSLWGRATTELALLGLVSISSVELIVRTSIITLASPCLGQRSNFQGWESSGDTLLHSIKALATNLFFANISPENNVANRQIYKEAAQILGPVGAVKPIQPKTDSSDLSCIKQDLNKVLEREDRDWAKLREEFKIVVEESKVLHQQFDQMLHDPSWHKLMVLSHWLGISGGVKFKGIPQSLEGNLLSWTMFKDLAGKLQEFIDTEEFNSCSLEKEKAYALVENLLLAEQYPIYETFSIKIKNKEIYFIETGWRQHNICLAFCGNYMAIGNRGPTGEYSTLEVYKIDPSRIKSETIDAIKLQNKESEQMSMYVFHQVLPKKLSSSGEIEQDALCHYFRAIAPGVQKVGNCTLAGKKAALRFAWAMCLSDEPDQAVLERARLETKIFTDWAAVKMCNEFNPEEFPELEGKEEFFARVQARGKHKKERLESNIAKLRELNP